MEKGKNLIERLKQTKGIWLLVVGVCAGILLLLFGTLSSGESSNPKGFSDEKEIQQYSENLEKKIQLFLEEMTDVANVHVLVTLESGSESIYALESNSYAQSNLPMLVKELPPTVRGIAIVCKGGEKIQLQQEIIQLLSTVFHVSSNRVYVTGGK